MFHIPAHKNVNNPAAQSTLVDSVYLPTDLAVQIPANERATAQVLGFLEDEGDYFCHVFHGTTNAYLSQLKRHKDFTLVEAGSSIGDTELAFGV